MKKTILILLLTISAIAWAQDNTLNIEAGFIPSSSSMDYSNISNKLKLIENALYIELDTRIYVGNFFAGGSVLTYMFLQENDTAMFPFYTSYTFNGGLSIGDLEVGYEHRCSHPIATLNYIQEPLFKVDSASDKVYIRYGFKF